jgi:hypothetical protein
VHLVFGCGGIEFLDDGAADDLLLDPMPFSARFSGVVVDCPGRGSSTPRSVSTSLVAWMKSKTLAIPTYGTAWYTISLTSTGVTPAANAAPSITRYSRRAWEAIIDAS